MKKKSNKQAHQKLILSPEDIPAILCALPLVSCYETGNPIQDRLNASYIETAAKKLSLRDSSFLQGELMVIYAAISLSVNLNAYLPGVDIDAEWKRELQTHFFTLNKLYTLHKDHLSSE